MIRIIREHAGRYSVIDGGDTIGQIVQQSLGWHFRNSRGHGPRQPRSSPAAALDLASALTILPNPVPWRDIVRAADQAFHHNERIARKDAR